MVKINEFTLEMIDEVAAIHRNAFPNDGYSLSESKEWIRSKFHGWPTNRYYVAVNEQEIVGYILWVQMGGFRNECVLSLEQIAVSEKVRGQGIGTILLDCSLEKISAILKKEKRKIKLIEVTTGTANRVQSLYKNTIGAKVNCTIPDFFDDDEVVMVARIKEINLVRKSRGLLQL